MPFQWGNILFEENCSDHVTDFDNKAGFFQIELKKKIKNLDEI